MSTTSNLIQIKNHIIKEQDRWGPKVRIFFNYDPNWVAAIKSLPWDETHRRWDGEAWELDKNPHSLMLLSEIVEELPSELREIAGVPDYSDNRVVTIKIVGNNATITPMLPNHINLKLNSILCYRFEGYEFTPSYQAGTWDGMIYLYRDSYQSFPVGLMRMVTELLAKQGFETVIEDTRPEGSEITYSWNGPVLRDYQSEVVLEAINKQTGTISLPTGAGKTMIGLNLIYQLRKKAIVLVHRKELLYQWADRVEKTFGVTCGVIGDGKFFEGVVTVAMLQTLSTGKELKGEYGIMIADECHHIPAETFQKVADNISAKYRYGLSATAWRGDGKDLLIFAQTSNIIKNVTVQDLVDDGYLAKPVFKIYDCNQDMELYGEDPHDPLRRNKKNYKQMYNEYIRDSKRRNGMIVDITNTLYRLGHRIYIDVTFVKHGRNIEKMLRKEGILNKFISGSDTTKTRNRVLAEFEDEEQDPFVLVSTLIKEGVDLPKMTTIILAGGGKGKTQMIQSIGRSLRPKINGTNEAIIVDFNDNGAYLLEHSRLRRKVMKDYYGKLYQERSM